MGFLAGHVLDRVPGDAGDGFHLQSAAVLFRQEAQLVAVEGDRGDGEDECNRRGRPRERVQQPSSVPLAEEHRNRPGLDHRPQSRQRAEPGRAAVDDDQCRDREHCRHHVEPQHRQSAQHRHRQQPDPDARVAALAAAEGHQQDEADQVEDEHRRDEGIEEAGRADARQEHQEGCPGWVLPCFFVGQGVFGPELVRPDFEDRDVFVLHTGRVVPEADVAEDQEAGQEPDPRPDPDLSVAQHGPHSPPILGLRVPPRLPSRSGVQPRR